LSDNLKGRDHSKDLGVDGTIKLEVSYGNMGKFGLEASGSG